MKIYTRGNRPFVMGGKVHYFLGTDVEASEPFDVGRGVSCRLVVAPNGDTFCVEAETGAIVGATPGDVKSDMAKVQAAKESRNTSPFPPPPDIAPPPPFPPPPDTAATVDSPGPHVRHVVEIGEDNPRGARTRRDLLFAMLAACGAVG